MAKQNGGARATSWRSVAGAEGGRPLQRLARRRQVYH
jgi:hypothetical protein